MTNRLTICLLALLLAAIPAAADEYLLTGNDSGLWLLRLKQGEEGPQFDVVRRPGHKNEWKWVAESIIGRPAVAAAVGDRLHVLYAESGGYGVFDADGGYVPLRRPASDRWPRDAAPLCAAEAVFGGEEPTLVAVVPRNAGRPTTKPALATQPAETRPDTQPASAPALQSRPAELTTMGVFQERGSHWRHVADLPPGAMDPDAHVLLGSAGGRLYALVSPGRGQANSLYAITDGGAVEAVNLPSDLASVEMLALFGMQNRLALLAAMPGEGPESGVLYAAVIDPADGTTAQWPVLKDNDEPFGLPAAPLRAARLTERVSLVWRDAEGLFYAHTSLSRGAKLTKARPLEIFVEGRMKTDGQTYYQIFTWVLFGAILLAMIVFRSRATMPKPLSLPRGVQPARLSRRLIAAAIDLLPFILLNAVLFVALAGPQEVLLQQEQLRQMVMQGEMPNSLAYATIAALVAFGAYSIFMELRYGATLGKMAVGLKVVEDEGKPAALRAVLLRNLVKVFEVCWPMLMLLALLLMMMNRSRQRLGDMLARTIVVEPDRTEGEAAKPGPAKDEDVYDLGPVEGPDEPPTEEDKPAESHQRPGRENTE